MLVAPFLRAGYDSATFQAIAGPDSGKDGYMASTTLGVKVDDLLRSRLKDAATRLERTPHWLIKQAIFAYLEKIEHGQLPPELSGHTGSADLADGASVEQEEDGASHPFLEFA